MYNTRVNHIKSSRALERTCYPFSTCDRSARTMPDHTPFFPENLDDYAPWVAKHGLVAPYGKCQCGCGQDTAISQRTQRREQRLVGHPVRFVRWHHKWSPSQLTVNPDGLCLCGCGQRVRRGRLFVSGHNGRVRPVRPVAERFWEKVDKRGPDECWEWKAGKTKFGYGSFRYRGRQETALAHRVAYRLHYGNLPSDLLVCHQCDNPACCNPTHLFVGTHQDNADDMVAKNRYVSGVAKVTTDQVLAIHAEIVKGRRSADIARQFGVSLQIIGNIRRGKTWRRITEIIEVEA